jgi:hypothetical protein
MHRILLSAVLALFVAACAPTGGLLVSDKARDMGGNLFVETADNGSSFLVLDGEITSETAYVFQALVERARVEGLVIAQSPGGDLLAAHQIGRTIKRERMNTLVLVSCISACVDVFIAGKNREMTDFAELGLHSATNRDVSYQLDRRYWREMGFPTINEKAYRIPNSRVWIMDARRARELKVATNVISGPR